METVNMHEAKTHLSRLVEKASKGEPFIIARAGKPLVKVVPVDAVEAEPKKRFDFIPEGTFIIPDNFDRYMEDEILEMFEGSPPLEKR